MGVVYLVVALLSALYIVLLSSRSRGRRANEPPGPWQLPVIGSLHHLLGQLPHHAMGDLARRYGPVMLLRLGEVPTLVVTSREGAREVMKTHDIAFATRPLSATISIMTNGGRDIVFAPYGDYWRQIRKIAVVELLSAQRVLSFRAIREGEVAAMLRDVAEAAAAARPVELRARLSTLVTDITVRAVMGDRFKERDVYLCSLERSMKLLAGFNPPDLWPSSSVAEPGFEYRGGRAPARPPWLRPWSSWLVGYLSGSKRRGKECLDTVNGIVDAIIRERLEKTMEGESKHPDLLDALLSMHKKDRHGRSQICHLRHVRCRQRVGNDDTGVGDRRAHQEPNGYAESDERGPASLQGSRHRSGAHPRRDLVHAPSHPGDLRLHMPSPLLVPWECQESCQVLGYEVSQGTRVLVNAWALARDERYWPDAPDEFRPERFEGETAVVDFNDTEFSFLPFGAGRRICPGIAFGLANIELVLASLLFHFDWEGPPPDELDMAEAFGVTARRKAALLLRPVLRVPVHGGGNGDAR